MSAEFLHKTIGELVAERPSRARVFERWGLDYCCGGKQRLADICAKKAVSLNNVLDELEAEAAKVQLDNNDWTTAPLSDLVTHIICTHHAFLRETLPRLTFLTEKVRNAHSERHPELVELAQVFAAFRLEMEAHAEKEEQVLFPFIVRLEQASSLPAFACGSVHNPIQHMEEEHEQAGAALETMNRLTNGYKIPAGACATYRVMLNLLAELEADTHRHVHKENSILFPRAEAREAELAARIVPLGNSDLRLSERTACTR